MKCKNTRTEFYTEFYIYTYIYIYIHIYIYTKKCKNTRTEMQEHKAYIIIHEIDSEVCINLYEHDSDCAQSQRPNKEGGKTSKKMTPS